MGEGLARAITIISIVLTVGSLVIAFALARRRSRIRPGFDIARAFVGVGAIVVVALLAHTWAPVAATVPAIAAGLGLGFAQGAALQVSPGAAGFYASRSPIALALWGVGVVVIQVAGIAARTGAVQIGQGIAWFSACLGIGLMLGRNRPLRRARQGMNGGAAAAVLLALALAVALAGGAAAQTVHLTDDEVCALIPAYEGLWGAGWYDTDWGEPDESRWARCSYTVPGRVTEDSVLGVDVLLHSSREAAQEGFEWVSGVIAESGGAATLVDIGDAARHWAWNPDWDPNRQLFETLVAVGPFVIRVTGNNVDTLPAAQEVAAAAAELVPAATTTTIAATTTSVSGSTSTTAPATTSTGGTTSTLPSEPGGPSGGESEPITPQEAAAQAIAGLIAAAAIGAISWVEAAAGIQEILGGSGTGAPAEQPPADTAAAAEAPPEPPPADTAAAAEAPPEQSPAAGRRVDPCAFQQERYEGALHDWRRIQAEIDALRSEYRALQVQIEADRVRDAGGALFDLGMMGIDLLGAEPPTPGVFKAMVDSAGQEFVRSIMKQTIQALAAGQTPDPGAILLGAADGAVGASDLVSGKLPGGAFGEFFAQSITALLAGNKAYDAMKLIDTLAEPGAIADPELVRALEQSTFEVYFRRVGPWVGVVTKAIDLYYKNKDWGEGIERRNGMRAELTRLGTRIGELEYDLGYATEALDSYLGFLSRCREETR